MKLREAPTDFALTDPFAEADEDTGQVKQSQQDYIHIRIQRASAPTQPILSAFESHTFHLFRMSICTSARMHAMC